MIPSLLTLYRFLSQYFYCIMTLGILCGLIFCLTDSILNCCILLSTSPIDAEGKHASKSNAINREIFIQLYAGLSPHPNKNGNAFLFFRISGKLRFGRHIMCYPIAYYAEPVNTCNAISFLLFNPL